MAEEAKKTDTKTATKKGKLQGKDGTYYIVNPAGAVHTVSRAHARTRLRQVGWRLAEENEIKQYLEQRVQRHKSPIAEPWTPEPDEEIDLPEEE